MTASVYSADERYLGQVRDAALDVGVALSENLTGGVYVNQTAAFSDFHATGANPAANAALDPVREVEFGALLSMLDISKSALSKHVSMLAEAGYVAQRRAVRDTRQRVWLSLTEAGRSAYRGHVAALHRIVGHTRP